MSAQDELQTMLDDIEKRAGKLTDWETTFIDSVQRQMERHALSPKQVEIIERIWERIT